MMTFMPDPPFHLMARQPASNPLRPFGRLTHPVWASAVTAYVKDTASLAELRRKNWGNDAARAGDKSGSKGSGKGAHPDA